MSMWTYLLTRASRCMWTTVWLAAITNKFGMEEDYVEYKCSACKKEIKNIVTACKRCNKIFLHPGCVCKHKVYNKYNELVACDGPYEKFSVESEKKKDRTLIMSKSGRERLGTAESAGSSDSVAGVKKPSGIDLKIDCIVRSIKEMKDEMMKQKIQGEIVDLGAGGMTQRSYSNIVKKKAKESIIIVKPKVQQGSEDTKKVIKEKINIKNIAVGITKMRKGNKGTVVLGCETGEEIETLKNTVQEKLGKDYEVAEPIQKKPKVKIIGIGEEEMKLDEDRNHKESECTSRKKKFVNCMHKIHSYNLKLNDEHDALDPECPDTIWSDVIVRIDNTGGVILYIREEIRYDITLQEKVNSNCWCVAIEVKEKWYKGSIAVMYHSPSAPDSVFVDFLEDITERLVLKGDCIIVGDFNINILEDSFYTKKIHTIMLGLGMKQYVDKPTRVTKDSQTIIDLIFANRKINIQDRYKEWWGRNYSKINVHNFVLLMEENKIQGQELCVNVKANNFVNSIVNVLDIVAPKKKFRIPKVWEGKKWYTDEIREAVSIDNIVKSIEGEEKVEINRRVIYPIVNKKVIYEFEMINLGKLEQIVMSLPNKKGTQEDLINDLLRKGQCPEEWKTSEIILIKKILRSFEKSSLKIKVGTLRWRKRK
ncbi:hypothetical protein X777_11299 [Ooceraea biroi]|uniref:Endonuclease/exonuclease/phosphatase domain-containing protein n=1 Tax=Ooceraea biroi TaxID=2015173 RepID=A0A026W2Q1_OOCBI|nr:hypothetical protein X777_11299 [Ooceraea biroi]